MTHVIGLMSGSSLDGVDLAHCTFSYDGTHWQWQLLETSCIQYTHQWVVRLREARNQSGLELWRLHSDLGHLYGNMCRDFMQLHGLGSSVSLIASHGHTVFHYPGEGFTTQLGDGAAIASVSGVATACDFRSSDVALGGQGTPIVPIGDSLLFGDYPFLMNIGGIANLSAKTARGMVAFDIVTANQVLNHYAQQLGIDYDMDGAVARGGSIYEPLLTALQGLPYQQQLYPKSLDNGYTTQVLIPLINKNVLSIPEILCTYCEYIAQSIAQHLEKVIAQERIKAGANSPMLITGGGALHHYLIERIKLHSPVAIQIPDIKVVQYKEALVIAFMGLLRQQGIANVLRTVTGASRDNIGGAIYLP